MAHFKRIKPFILVFLLIFCDAAWAQWMTQTIHLRPGWNAVFLEVDPSPNDSDIVFSGVPVKSVWMWNKRFQSIQYIQDPQVLMPKQPEWLCYFPPFSTESALTNLHVIWGGRSYLINLDGDQEMDWNVTGIPRIRKQEWMINSYNLAGFYIDPAAPPTFQDYFAPEPALAGQDFYELSEQGKWEKIASPDTQVMEAGKSYWMYCLGQCEYQGPLSVKYGGGRILDFADKLSEKQLFFVNETDTDTTITITHLVSEPPPDPGSPPLAGPVLYSYYKIVPSKRIFRWVNLPEPFKLGIPADGKSHLRLGIRRVEMSETWPPQTPDDLYQGILEVTDGLGSRIFVPVASGGIYMPYKTMSKPQGSKLYQEAVNSYAGLWIGSVTINGVSRPGKQNTEPTASDFTFRLLIHYDGEKSRLLQEAYMMYKEEEVECTSPSQSIAFPEKIRDEEGRLVDVIYPDDKTEKGESDKILQEPEVCYSYEPCLFSYQDNIPDSENFVGIELRDGVPVPRRVSSVAFGFCEEDAKNGIESIEGQHIGDYPGILKFPALVPMDDPVNPFLHRFHPDHNNLDPLGNELVTRGDPYWMDYPDDPESIPIWTIESYGIKRIITLESTDIYPPGEATPKYTWGQGEFGTTLLGGVYTEQISGLTKETITVKGEYLLRKCSNVSVLNPQ